MQARKHFRKLLCRERPCRYCDGEHGWGQCERRRIDREIRDIERRLRRESSRVYA